MIFGSTYSPKGFLGRIDSRIKMISAMALIFSIALTLNISAYLVTSLLLIYGILLSQIPVRLLFAGLRPFIVLVLITFVLHLLFSSDGGTPVFEFLGRSVTTRGIIAGGLFAWRISLFFMVALLFSLTTDPIDISDGFVKLLWPLKQIKIPVDQIGLMIFMAFRFIPLLAEESRAIYAAQLSRGFNPSGGLWARLKNASPLLVSIFASSLRRADQMAVALEARGFNPWRERTTYRQFKITSADWVFFAIVLTVSAIDIILSVYV